MFYFAWVAPTETTFDPVAHRVEDEKILSVDLSQSEAEFPALSIEVQNPRVGLLAPGRKQWCWLSFTDDGTGATDPTPLFFGRLIGIPSDLQSEVVALEFLARPRDWDEQRRAVADALKVLPYYDPVWFNQEARDDPDSVLEGYTLLWHVDRVTHVVTASDILNGEDGTIDFAGDYFRDSLSVKYDKIPGRSVAVKATAQWDQEVAGTVDLTGALVDAFHASGGQTGHPYLIESFTGQGLVEDWPEKGDGIGAGWKVGESLVTRVDGKINEAGEQVVVQADNGRIINFPRWTLKPTFNVDYAATRSRSETVEFTIEADVQALLTDPGEEEVIQLELTSAELNQPIDAGGAMPIGDLSRRTYFQTSRGWDSIAYLIARARATLVSRSRAVVVTVQVPWEAGLAVSLRKSAIVRDERLPCGQAAGKIVSYSMTADGDGTRQCTVMIACTIGQGNSVEDAPGDPAYVEDGYVEDGYQVRLNRVVMPIAGLVTFVPPEGVAIADDGLDFNNLVAADVLLPVEGTHTEPDEPGIDVVFGPGPQKHVIQQGGADMAAVIEALSVAYTVIRVNLKPLTRGPFEQTYVVDVSDLMIPKTIDLECDDTDTAT